jgi:phosphoglycolate phosphatase
MHEAVLFDLDGTLADTARDLGAALNRLRSEVGLADLPFERLRPVASNGVRGLLQAGLGLCPEHADYAGFAQRFLDHYMAALCVDTVLFDGIPELLDDLEASGIAWGIVTNKQQRFTLPLVDMLGLGQRAGCIVSGDSAPRAKPHPEPLLLASEQLKVDPQRCIYVGDDIRDVQAGRSAGMYTVAAGYGYLGCGEPISAWGADRIIEHPGDLLQFVRRAS